MTAERTERQKFASVYGRGYHDGMSARNAAQPQKDDLMNAAKEEAVMRNQTELAKRVHECTPIQEQWQASKIRAEVVRQYGSAPPVNVVTGCLNTMKEAGLVQEPMPGHFARKPSRVAVRVIDDTVVKLVPPAAAPAAPAPHAAAAAPVFSPLERIASLSERVSAVMRQLQELSSEIESVALETQDYLDRVNKDGAKLRQLQALLKDLS